MSPGRAAGNRRKRGQRKEGRGNEMVYSRV